MKKNIAVVAHDNCKKELLDWIKVHQDILVAHNLIATGTTGGLVERLFLDNVKERSVNKLKSGPLGGDQQLGAAISEGKIEIFLSFSGIPCNRSHMMWM